MLLWLIGKDLKKQVYADKVQLSCSTPRATSTKERHRGLEGHIGKRSQQNNQYKKQTLPNNILMGYVDQNDHIYNGSSNMYRKKIQTSRIWTKP